MEIRAALRQASEVLEENAVPAPRLTAEVLLAHLLGRDRAWLYAHPEEALSWDAYFALLDERISGTPTQYILGHQEFYGREFRVTPDVFIPRPETEHLVEEALKRKPGVVLDVGCGSGAIGITLSLELPQARVFTTDISFKALQVARENARALGARVEFINGDLATAIRPNSLDLLVSNPPYIPTDEHLPREVAEHEPHTALFAGPDGLDNYRRLIADAPRLLRPGGWLLFELGYRQASSVSGSTVPEIGWTDLAVIPDLAGLPRVFAARYCGHSR